uniref:LIM zinc-binding domain-containing protein n=1 Tax=Romanomermis culicivorax TaxID=13658 RepID=A0A915KFR0_ROMCU
MPTDTKKILCRNCNTPLESQLFYQIQGHYYHTKCFNCDSCSASLSDGYHHSDGHFFCVKCYTNYMPKCAKCEKVIGLKNGRCTKALDRMWHSECFTCEICKKPLDCAFYFVIDGRPYCYDDYVRIQSKEQQNNVDSKTSGNKKTAN